MFFPLALNQDSRRTVVRNPGLKANVSMIWFCPLTLINTSKGWPSVYA